MTTQCTTSIKCLPSLEDQISSEVCVSCLRTVLNIASFQFETFDNANSIDPCSWSKVGFHDRMQWKVEMMHLATEEQSQLSKEHKILFLWTQEELSNWIWLLQARFQIFLQPIHNTPENSHRCNTMYAFSGCLSYCSCSHPALPPSFSLI